jgi:hypothetical protein
MENETLTFGKPTDTAATQETVKPNANQSANKETYTTEVFGDKPKTETPAETVKESVDNKGTEDKPNKQETETTKKEEAPKADAKAESDFEVNFGSTNKTETKEKDNKGETPSLSEEQVLGYLKSINPELEIEKLSDLSKKETLPESVLKFKKFVEETGRTDIKDFYNTQRDWTKESDESLIKEFYKLQDPNATDEDVNLQYELLQVTEDDEDNLSERELKQRQLEFKNTKNKALNYLEEKRKEYQTPKAVQPKAPTKEEIAAAYKPYWEQRDKALDELKEFKFTTSVGDVEVEFSEDDKKLISQYTQTQEDYFKDWQGEKGLNAKQVVEDTGWRIPAIREKKIAEIARQVHALTLEQFSKQNRNVKLDPVPQKTQEAKKGSLEVIGGDNQSQRFGQPLIPKK